MRLVRCLGSTSARVMFPSWELAIRLVPVPAEIDRRPYAPRVSPIPRPLGVSGVSPDRSRPSHARVRRFETRRAHHSEAPQPRGFRHFRRAASLRTTRASLDDFGTTGPPDMISNHSMGNRSVTARPAHRTCVHNVLRVLRERFVSQLADSRAHSHAVIVRELTRQRRTAAKLRTDTCEEADVDATTCGRPPLIRHTHRRTASTRKRLAVVFVVRRAGILLVLTPC
jgi:hypothetical protein